MSPANSSDKVVNQAFVEILMHDISLFIKQLNVDIDIAVHQKIDQFFYMEKREELRMLNERIEELNARISLMEGQRDFCCAQVKERLGLDVAWLNEFRDQRRVGP